MLTEIRVPLHDSSGSAYEKVERRVGDWAVAAAGVSLQLRAGRIERAGIALAAVGAEMTATAAETALDGHAALDAAVRARRGDGGGALHPVSDQRGSNEYKRHVVGVLTERALTPRAGRAAMTEEV